MYGKNTTLMSVQKCIGKYFRVEFASSRPSMATPNHGILPIMFVPGKHLGVRHGWGREMANCFDHIAGSCVFVEENEFVIPVAIDVMHGDHARMCHIACSTSRNVVKTNGC